MEDEELLFPPQEGEEGTQRVLRSSCIGTKCLCVSKGLKHHQEEHEEQGDGLSSETNPSNILVSEPSSLKETRKTSWSSHGYGKITTKSSFSSASTESFSRLQSSHVIRESHSSKSGLSTYFGTTPETHISTVLNSSRDLHRKESPSGIVSSRSSYLSSSRGNLDSSTEAPRTSSFLSMEEYQKMKSSFSKDYSPDTSSFSDSLDSPRHRLFKDFRNWINSPRTGYTYAESETYGSETESKYEVPMPHMARNPIHPHLVAGDIPSKKYKNVSFKVKRQQNSFLFSIKKLFRKVFYEIPASLLIFDTKLLLKSRQNVVIRTLLYLWTILCVYPIQYLSHIVSSILHFPVSLYQGLTQKFGKQDKIVEANLSKSTQDPKKPRSSFSFKSLVNLRQSLADASKRYKLNKLKEKMTKVNKKRKHKSYGPPTRRSRRLRGIPAEKYELPKKWRRRLKKKKNAMKQVKIEENHILTDAWYSILSLFSLSSYTEDDLESETDQSDSEDEFHRQENIPQGTLLRTKPNKLFYFLALMISYFRMPFDCIGSSYYNLRMSLAKKIYHLFDHEYLKDEDLEDSDSDEDDDIDEEDIEEFMERRYLIQDITTYLFSLAIPPSTHRKNSNQRIASHMNPKSSTSERTSILRHKYESRKTSGISAEISDTEDSDVEVTYTKIKTPSEVPSISTRFRNKVSKMFSSSKEEPTKSRDQAVKVPGIVLSSDEEVVSVIQVPKLYTRKKRGSIDEKIPGNSWRKGILAIVLSPWNLIISSMQFLRNEFKIWTGFRSASSSLRSNGDGFIRQLGGSISNGIRNTGFLIGSLCIYMCLPLIHGARRILNLFSSRDEVDEDRPSFAISEDEGVDEGFDSLSDDELQRKVLQQNMKLFSSELSSTPAKSKERKSSTRCRALIPFLLCLILIPLCLYGLWPLMSTSNALPSISWISSKSNQYLDGVKVLQNKVQENGKSSWLSMKAGLGLMSDFVLTKIFELESSLSSLGSYLSGGFSRCEKSLRNYFSNLLDSLSNFFYYSLNGLSHSYESFWNLIQTFLLWVRNGACNCYNKLREIVHLLIIQSNSFATQTGKSMGNKLAAIPLFFSNLWVGERSSNPTQSSTHELKDDVSPTPSFKTDHRESDSKPSLLSTADYDIIVEKIISNEKFQELAKSSPPLEDESEMIKASKNEIIKIVNDQEEKLQKDYSELKDLLRQQKETLDAHQESYETWKRDIEAIFLNLKVEIQGLSSNEVGNSQHLLQELQDKILALEDNSHKLFNLSSNCCDSISSLDIESRVKEYFQDSDGKEVLLNQLKQTFISKEENTDRLSKLKSEVLDKLESLRLSSGGAPLGVDSIHRVVQEALIRYDADKTGKFDYALESAGGSIISTRCTETYVKKTALYTLLGLPLWYPSNNPRTAIQPGVHPGECWAFKGSEGFLVIHLSNAIVPQSFSIEHIPKSMSPTGSIDSAPKDFIVLGLKTEKDPEPVHLGRYSYSSSGDPLQSFDILQPVEESFDIIELNILSNHGNINFTCLYRFRVHGSPAAT